MIATAAPGTQVSEVVQGCGVVVAPGDALALKEAIAQLANDAPLRARPGAAARDYAMAHLDKEAVLLRFEAELLKLVRV